MYSLINLDQLNPKSFKSIKKNNCINIESLNIVKSNLTNDFYLCLVYSS